jgi:hypothetical protein
VLAVAAAGVVVVHHALADASFGLAHAGTDRRDHPAGLVSRDHLLAAAAEAEGGRLVAVGAVELEIAAAHAGGLDLQHHLARTGRRIGEVSELELPVAGEDDSAHGTLLRRCR